MLLNVLLFEEEGVGSDDLDRLHGNSFGQSKSTR